MRGDALQCLVCGAPITQGRTALEQVGRIGHLSEQVAPRPTGVNHRYGVGRIDCLPLDPAYQKQRCRRCHRLKGARDGYPPGVAWLGEGRSRGLWTDAVNDV